VSKQVKGEVMLTFYQKDSDRRKTEGSYAEAIKNFFEKVSFFAVSPTL
jgi:hypothetical protein